MSNPTTTEQSVEHGPRYPERILFPVQRRRNPAIRKAVQAVVKELGPRSLCYCGKFCAVHRKLQEQKG